MQGLTDILLMPCAAWVRVWAFVECMTFWTIFLSDIRPKALCFFHFGASFFFCFVARKFKCEGSVECEV